MTSLQKLILSALLLTVSPLYTGNVLADPLIDQASNVFKFQQKLALTGNEQAQYKLATMYETGDGVEADLLQAKHWYTEASSTGNKAANDRNTYLEIKQRGFNKTTDTAWLNGIKADADDKKVEALRLLGELYRQGLGVEKDLDKSLELLTQVNIRGAANVDREIAGIRAEMEAEKIAEQRLQDQRQVSRLLAMQEEQKRIAEEQANAELKADLLQSSKEEKRRRYEAVMMQLKKEQMQIDRQQTLVSGGNVAAIDDEI
jgi:DNA-binding transcriptional ArsR family regulator